MGNRSSRRRRSARWAAVAALATAVAMAAAAVANRAAAPGSAAPADTTWQEHYRLGRAAFAADDLAAARHHFERADAIVGGHSGAIYNLAIVETRLGRIGAALDRLEAYAATGLVRDAGGDTLLAPLRGDPRFARIVRRLEANGEPRSNARLFRDLADPSLLVEDVAWSETARRHFVSSIHRRKVLALEADGTVRDFAGAGEPDFWGAFGLRVDPRRSQLWVTTCALPTIEGYQAADSGRAALVAYDVATGARLRRADLPRDGRAHVLGDLTVGPDGTVYVTDSVGGGVYALRPGAVSFDTLAAPGTFRSPQTPVLAPGGRRLLVPDYPRGLASLDLGTGRVAWLPKPRTLASGGIDGLYAVPGGLIAIQNGTTPRRVLRLDMDPALTRIRGWRVLEQASERLGEPSHGVVVGDRLDFIGDSGWDRVNGEEQLVTTAASPSPVILRLDLKTRR